MDEITSALERIAEEVAPACKGEIVVKNFVPSYWSFPFPNSVVNRVSYIEEQTRAKFLGFIPYKKRKMLVSVCETWLFHESTEHKVFVQCIDSVAGESARKHLAEYL